MSYIVESLPKPLPEDYIRGGVLKERQRIVALLEAEIFLLSAEHNLGNMIATKALQEFVEIIEKES